MKKLLIILFLAGCAKPDITPKCNFSKKLVNSDTTNVCMLITNGKDSIQKIGTKSEYLYLMDSVNYCSQAFRGFYCTLEEKCDYCND